MGKLIYSAICSLDGYVEDPTGDFQWAAPDEQVFRAVIDLERPIGTYLYGRRMYETMRYWQDTDSTRDSAAEAEFGAIWRAADKIVFSRTLTSVQTPKTAIVTAFDPDGVRAMKAASDSDLSVGGSDLAGQALSAGLVDEVHLYLAPLTVGGGKPVFPHGVRTDLDLVDVRRFRGGSVELHYRCGDSLR
ncbi:MAG TPA: dihydrofolate reductase family protein [Mycobacteriales bacterium]|nr:dihydrofolate reductase family protein [Mycobacteriales bacterium]